MTNYPAIIQKVHDDFFSAEDRAVETAKEIVASYEKIKLDKGNRLKRNDILGR